MVKTKGHLFLGKQIITLSPTAHIKLNAIVHIKSHCFSLFAFKSFTFPFTALLHRIQSSCTTANESAQTLLAAGDTAANAKTISGAESDVAVASSSSNVAIVKMAKKDVPVLTDYWKKSMVTEADRSAYHYADWLPGGVESFIPYLEFPIVDNTTIVCFEYLLVARLGLPPSKFLISILNFLRCELVHLNPNAIAVLNYFTMLCELWLMIAPDISLFWYFYYPVRYDKTVYSRIRLSLHRHFRKEYLDATFKGCWKGAS
jgi:hypothetical protein